MLIQTSEMLRAAFGACQAVMPPLSGGVSLSVDEFEQLGRSADGQRQDVQFRQTRMSVIGKADIGESDNSEL
jgi:hypothetical protein